MTNPALVSDLNSLVESLGQPGDLRCDAAQAATRVLVDGWTAPLNDDSNQITTVDLTSDVDLVVEHLTKFRKNVNATGIAGGPGQPADLHSNAARAASDVLAHRSAIDLTNDLDLVIERLTGFRENVKTAARILGLPYDADDLPSFGMR
jgi:hypothetical protein